MHTATVVFAADGTPSLGTVTKETWIGGVLAGVTQLVSADKIVIPADLLEKVAVEGTKAAIAAGAQKYISTGQFSIPFTK